MKPHDHPPLCPDCGEPMVPVLSRRQRRNNAKKPHPTPQPPVDTATATPGSHPAPLLEHDPRPLTRRERRMRHVKITDKP
jgi:hypothetical protein